MAIKATSKGIFKIISPLSENIIKMVNSREFKVIGEIKGKNLLLYQSSPFAFTKISLLKNPNKKGIPR